MDIRERYPLQFELLTKLLSTRRLTLDDSKVSRLTKIHDVSESKWFENLGRLADRPIQYLFIGEAPPWTPDGEDVKYFYNTCNSRFHDRLWAILCPTHQKPHDVDERLKVVAQRGFLLVDSLPFSADYSEKKSLRDHKYYFELVKSCLKLMNCKLENPLLTWAPELKVAFFLTRNVRALIAALPKGLTLPGGQHLNLSESLAVNDTRGNVKVAKLKQVFGIK